MQSTHSLYNIFFSPRDFRSKQYSAWKLGWKRKKSSLSFTAYFTTVPRENRIEGGEERKRNFHSELWTMQPPSEKKGNVPTRVFPFLEYWLLTFLVCLIWNSSCCTSGGESDNYRGGARQVSRQGGTTMPGGKASLCVLTDGDPEGCHENNPNFGVVRREENGGKEFPTRPPSLHSGRATRGSFFARIPRKTPRKREL